MGCPFHMKSTRKWLILWSCKLGSFLFSANSYVLNTVLWNFCSPKSQGQWFIMQIKRDGNIQIKSWNDTRLKIVPYRGKNKNKEEGKLQPSVSVSPGNSCVHWTNQGSPCHPRGDYTAGTLRGRLWLLVDWVEKEKGKGIRLDFNFCIRLKPSLSTN